MRFHEFGDKKFPHILLIHGGGNSWWTYLRQARILSDQFHVILPTLDGHGEEYQKDYISTEKSAQQIMDYIKNNCNGKLFAIGGVSLGGQIAIELLSLDSDIAQKAIIDGSICIPQPNLSRISTIIVKIFGKLMFSKSAGKIQLSLMKKMYPNMAYPEEIGNYYMEDMPRLPMKTLIKMYETYMGTYRLKESITENKAQVLYIYGEKEMRCVKESAKLFQKMHPACILYEAKGYNHGYLSAYLPLEWIQPVNPFLTN
ncbi:alpha/beta fold hydrolase [Bulleidia sp. zg-1006]|uniref:alpha/beta fold hydrolase n=1 Tax=Bulleidia sp. zg-1006 TaxID=2806552 RepID=UPI001939BB9D|nr:alpha/beta hydrolase [Bulleidia sp. zg-1006]QRG86258.1 alpha/beta hydrolase [Bulleidia sp. zg-1006]